MNKQRNSDPQFAICIKSDDPDLLTPRTVYRVLPDEGAARSNYLRVTDNEGEDYLYPADYFVLVESLGDAEEALLETSLATSGELVTRPAR